MSKDVMGHRVPGSNVVPLVSVKAGMVTANSRDVADVFGKRHADVLRAIDGLDCSAEFRERNFALTEAREKVGATTKVVRSFDMTKNGFAFLVMGFTGKEAAQFKEAYIAQFDAMEAALKGQTPAPKQRARLSAPEVQFKRLLSVGKAMGLSDNMAALKANAGVLKRTGVNVLEDMGMTHLLAPDNEPHLTATQIGQRLAERFGIPLSARAVNKMLVRYGFQSKDDTVDSGWSPTGKGEPFKEWQDTGRKHSDGAPVNQLRWRAGIVDAVAEEMRVDPEFEVAA